jgi:hypothetical protein
MSGRDYCQTTPVENSKRAQKQPLPLILGTVHILRNHIFRLLGPTLRKRIYNMTENKQKMPSS